MLFIDCFLIIDDSCILLIVSNNKDKLSVVKELFENYFIEVGVRIPTNLVGSESYVKFDFFKKRWDHTIAFYRKVAFKFFNFY